MPWDLGGGQSDGPGCECSAWAAPRKRRKRRGGWRHRAAGLFARASGSHPAHRPAVRKNLRARGFVAQHGGRDVVFSTLVPLDDLPRNVCTGCAGAGSCGESLRAAPAGPRGAALRPGITPGRGGINLFDGRCRLAAAWGRSNACAAHTHTSAPLGFGWVFWGRICACPSARRLTVALQAMTALAHRVFRLRARAFSCRCRGAAANLRAPSARAVGHPSAHGSFRT